MSNSMIYERKMRQHGGDLEHGTYVPYGLGYKWGRDDIMEVTLRRLGCP